MLTKRIEKYLIYQVGISHGYFILHWWKYTSIDIDKYYQRWIFS